MSFANVSSWPFRNDSGETIPAGGVFRATGAETDDAGGVFLTAEKSNTYGSQWSHYINGPAPVADGQFGLCFAAEMPVRAAYDGEETPVVGSSWGPINDSWLLHQYGGGFRIVGAASDGLVLVMRQPLLTLVVELDEDLEPDSSATASALYYDSNTGDWLDSGETVEVFDALGIDETITNTTRILCQWEHSCGAFVPSASQCPA